MSVVNRIVDALHVGEPDIAVVRAVYQRMRPDTRRDQRVREERKVLYRSALDRHHKNQEVYRFVVNGY